MLRDALSNALRWNPGGEPSPTQIIAAALGLVGPILLGAAVGRLPLGMAAAIGALALSRGWEEGAFRQRALGMAGSTVCGAAAIAAGSGIAMLGGAALFLIPVLAAVVALIGGINRTAGLVAAQVILVAIIGSGMSDAAGKPIALAALFLLGAIWAAALALALAFVFPARHAQHAPAAARRPALADQVRHWRKSLGRWAGWQYPARITACLVAAAGVSLLFPSRHTSWVSLTVAIVVRRQMSEAMARTIERALGTVAGVLLAMLLLLWPPPLPLLIGLVAVLGAARPLLRAANYAAYAALMTPLIMLLLDLGQAPALATMIDRLLATGVGCALSVTLGYWVWPQVEDRPGCGAGGAT
ncbi:MAG TPA: FUSC family protein [Xanthobacteraceae bacterium]|nr:FUSC family protein [Xanthobacteraceae bacterium]